MAFNMFNSLVLPSLLVVGRFAVDQTDPGTKVGRRLRVMGPDEVFGELQKLSKAEAGCYLAMWERRRLSASIAAVALSERVMAPLHEANDEETIVSTARAVADALAEESGKLGLVAYFDNPKKSDLVQFRVRRAAEWKRYDLRELLKLLAIPNGGGHEGAIGFRVPRDQVPDIDEYVGRMVKTIEAAIYSP